MYARTRIGSAIANTRSASANKKYSQGFAVVRVNTPVDQAHPENSISVLKIFVRISVSKRIQAGGRFPRVS
jgi:hypothetical protein